MGNNIFKHLIVSMLIILAFIACGGSGSSNIESSDTESINSVSRNAVPIANTQTVILIEDLVKPIILRGSDSDGDDLTYSVLTQPAHGILSGIGKNIAYTPKLNYVGTDSFTFKVNDGTVDSETVNITLTIRKNEKKVRKEITSFEIKGHMMSLGSYVTEDSAVHVVLSADESNAYVANGSSLDIIDISTLTLPKLLGRYTLSNNNPILWMKLSADGSKAYIAAYRLGLQIIDISTPDSPKLLGEYSTHGGTRTLTLSADGRKIYVLDDTSLNIIDISTPTTPMLVGSIGGIEGDSEKGIVLSADDSKAYIVNNKGLTIIDVSRPGTPIFLGSYTPFGFTGNSIILSADESKAYVGHNEGFTILNISTPSSPELLKEYRAYNRYMTLSKDESKVYLASGSLGLQIIDVSIPTEPVLLEKYDTLGLAEAVTLSGDEKRAYVADGFSGLQILDISTASSSRFLGNYSNDSFTRDILLSEDGSKAYLASSTSGLELIDISIPSSLTSLGSYDTRGEVNTVVLSADERKAYVADGSSGLDILDISNFSNPVLLGNYDTSGFLTNVKVSVDGSKAYVLDSSVGLHIINISISDTPTFLGSYRGSDKISDMVLSADESKMYMANDFSLDIIDITTPTAPTVLEKYNTNDYAIRELMISRDESKAYIVYRWGFKIFDISIPTKVKPLGSYTTVENTFVNKVAFSADESRAYVVNSSLGLGVVDISLVTNPTLLGRYHVGDDASSIILSTDGSKAYVGTSEVQLQVIDLSLSTQYKKQDFIDDELVLNLNNTEEKTMILNIDTDRDDIIVIGNYDANLSFLDYSTQEVKIPISSITGAKGQTIITLTLSHSGKTFTRTVYYNVY